MVSGGPLPFVLRSAVMLREGEILDQVDLRVWAAAGANWQPPSVSSSGSFPAAFTLVAQPVSVIEQRILQVKRDILIINSPAVRSASASLGLGSQVVVEPLDDAGQPIDEVCWLAGA